ncbi:MAG: ferredoxin [Clostridium argentinense]|uniref:Ferredoxin n=1 Tax=Clostridium faecium TaxID=2762223 RepID=A0ABR8YWA6_9CLOT|nr:MULTISPECIES: ferredoxin [Clostridium]MBD8048454.1 ferredoxin [Clostridium faecium]MBS5823438.1 ferredoxin [Clostridium argentinense]MDU1348577.1 ferredoxin [Clostridium argentinense]
MKSVLKVCDMVTSKDISNVRSAISSNQGVLACQILSESKEIEIVYDDYFISIDDIIQSIEDKGYTVL